MGSKIDSVTNHGFHTELMEVRPGHHLLHQIRGVEVGVEPHGVELGQLLARLVEQLPVAFGRPAVRNQDAHQPMRWTRSATRLE